MDPRRLDHARRHWIALDGALGRILSPAQTVRFRRTFISHIEAAHPDGTFDGVCAPYMGLLEDVPAALTTALHTIWRSRLDGPRVRHGTCATLEPEPDLMTERHHPPRRYPRHPVSIDCQVEGASGHASMRVSEMSLGGCFVDTRMQFTPDQIVTIRAALPAGEVEFTARIIYMLSGYGFGCAFEPLSDTARERLEEFLTQSA